MRAKVYKPKNKEPHNLLQGSQVELNERQMIIMEYLHRHKSMMNKDFRKMFPDYSDDTVLRELKFLKQKRDLEEKERSGRLRSPRFY